MRWSKRVHKHRLKRARQKARKHGVGVWDAYRRLDKQDQRDGGTRS